MARLEEHALYVLSPEANLSGLAVSAEAPATLSTRLLQLVLASVLLHAVLVVALLVVPLLRDDALPEPTSDVLRAFFVAPSVPAPPPPPPPPPASVQRAANTPAPRREDAPSSLIAPVEIPDVIQETSDLDLGVEGGVAGGVEGGVAGGVVGGVVGGLLDQAPATKPMRVGGEIREPQKLVHVNPAYPEMARAARVSGTVVIDCLIDPQGRVAEAHVVRSTPLLDQAALTAVKKWRYTPTLYGGIPVPVLMTVTVRFQIS